jgi:pimeloyl-ACP methyl ester carboxylesterase
MLLDLWGRGYSDSCADLPHDERLYTTEILVALVSSPLSWTGGPDGGFCLVGYSLGGGISAAFTSYFSNLVKSLVLVAPSGIMRPEHTSVRSKILYSTGVFPESLLYWLVKKRLQTGPMKKAENKATPTSALSAEVEGDAS